MPGLIGRAAGALNALGFALLKFQPTGANLYPTLPMPIPNGCDTDGDNVSKLLVYIYKHNRKVGLRRDSYAASHLPVQISPSDILTPRFPCFYSSRLKPVELYFRIFHPIIQSLSIQTRSSCVMEM